MGTFEFALFALFMALSIYICLSKRQQVFETVILMINIVALSSRVIEHRYHNEREMSEKFVRDLFSVYISRSQQDVGRSRSGIIIACGQVCFGM